MKESSLPTGPQELATAFKQLRERERLHMASDAILETALRNRMPLKETLTALFEILARHLKIESAFVRTYDESLELYDFHWSGPVARPFPVEVESFCERIGPLVEEGEEWTALGQELDVAGQSFGHVGVTLAGRLTQPEQEETRALLNTWSEVLDNRLASVAQARKKHQPTLQLSGALKAPVLDQGIDQAIARGLAYAPYADLLWCETAVPDLDEAKRFAEAIRTDFPGQLLAYNCSPSFNWKKNLDDVTIAKFQRELGAMGYKYQFITLAGIHNMWYNMFDLTHAYVRKGMTAYVEMVQEPEFAAAKRGYTFASHQQEVGAGYFDDVTTVIQGGVSSVTALTGSTEEEQFDKQSARAR